MIRNLLKKEIFTIYRKPQQIIGILVFFIVVCTMYPLASNAEVKDLHKNAATIIWISCLLSSFLLIEHLYKDDYDSGLIEYYLSTSTGLYKPILINLLVNITLLLVAITFIFPFICILFSYSWRESLVLYTSIMLGIPSIILLGSICNALTISLKNKGVLLSLLIFPLIIPILIMGAGSMNLYLHGMFPLGNFLLLLSVLIVCLVLSPIISSYILSII